jgi:hypothetical protein
MNMDGNTILVNEAEYVRLLEDSMFLDALEQVGVADCQVYEEAQQLMADWVVEEELTNHG